MIVGWRYAGCDAIGNGRVEGRFPVWGHGQRSLTKQACASYFSGADISEKSRRKITTHCQRTNHPAHNNPSSRRRPGSNPKFGAPGMVGLGPSLRWGEGGQL